MGSGRGAEDADLLRRLLRQALPAAQARHGGHKRLCERRDGELGAGHVPRQCHLLRRAERRARKGVGHLGRGARVGAPVVRQPGDHGVVVAAGYFGTFVANVAFWGVFLFLRFF